MNLTPVRNFSVKITFGMSFFLVCAAFADFSAIFLQMNRRLFWNPLRP
jgi:hypothetical protein